MHYLLFYTYVENILERRVPYREEHLARAEAARARGELIMGGAFAEPADGALLVFRADDEGVVRAFVENDPYVANDLVTEWRIRPWNVVIGG